MLVPSNASRNGHTIMMEALTAEQEKHIDRLSNKSDVFFYGDINLLNKEDIKIINDYNFVYNNGLGLLYNGFDYDKGTFQLQPMHNGKDIEYIVKWGPTIDAVEWFKYQHCLLGKPAKIVVYRFGTHDSWNEVKNDKRKYRKN